MTKEEIEAEIESLLTLKRAYSQLVEALGKRIENLQTIKHNGDKDDLDVSEKQEK